MSDLARALRRAAEGGLESLNLWSLGLEWQANAKARGSSGWNVRIDGDIATAAEKALAHIPGLLEPPRFEHRADPLSRLKDALDDLRETIEELV